MKIFRVLLVLCFPGLLMTPITSYAFEKKPYLLESGLELFIPRDKNGLIDPFAYFKDENILTHLDGYLDHVLRFVELLSNDNLHSTLSDVEAERLIDFVAFIVRFSAPKSRPDLQEECENQISELLELIYNENEEESLILFNDYPDYTFSPAISYENPEFLLCKDKKCWIRRKWHHFKHWVGKHKRPIIAAAVMAGAAATGAAIKNDGPPQPVNKPGEVGFRDDRPIPPPKSAAPDVPPKVSNVPTHPFPNQLLQPPPKVQLPEQAAVIIEEKVEKIKE